MINVIDYSLNRLYSFNIPSEILHETFRPELERRSLDSLIKEKIIINLVLPSCNLYSGKIKKIKILPEYAQRTDGLFGSLVQIQSSYTYFRIPKSVTENRRIIYALDIAYPLEAYSSYGYLGSVGGNTIPSLASQALASFTESPQSITPTPIIMDDNIIRLDPPMSVFVEFILSCMLEYDVNFTNISVHMYEAISELVLHATKAYIYNEMVLKIDRAELVGGKNLGVFKTIVDSYADSYEKFQEGLKKFRTSSSYDKDQLIDLISLMLP